MIKNASIIGLFKFIRYKHILPNKKIINIKANKNYYQLMNEQTNHSTVQHHTTLSSLNYYQKALIKCWYFTTITTLKPSSHIHFSSSANKLWKPSRKFGKDCVLIELWILEDVIADDEKWPPLSREPELLRNSDVFASLCRK